MSARIAHWRILWWTAYAFFFLAHCSWTFHLIRRHSSFKRLQITFESIPS